MDYEKLSDFEVNCLVLDLIGNLQGANICGKRKVITMLGVNLGEVVNIDYCNSPADAWPIILDNEICLDPRRTIKKLPWMASASNQIYSTGKNPLRAAMIVFLMMNEGR